MPFIYTREFLQVSSLVVPLQINLGSMLLHTINYDETMKGKKEKKSQIFFFRLNENIK